MSTRKYLTAYTGAMEAEGYTPFVSINVSTEDGFAEVLTRVRSGETQVVLVPLTELHRMALEIIKETESV